MSEKQYDNEKRFALHKNDKDGNEKRPDYKGTMQLNGVEYVLSAWIRTSKAGNKYMSGAMEEKKTRADAQSASDGFAKVKAAVTEPTEDDVPF